MWWRLWWIGQSIKKKLRCFGNAFKKYFTYLIDIIQKIKITVIQCSIPKKIRSEIVFIERRHSIFISIDIIIETIYLSIKNWDIGCCGIENISASKNLCITLFNLYSCRNLCSWGQDKSKSISKREVSIIDDVYKVSSF